jgi:hypothetical protein
MKNRCKQRGCVYNQIFRRAQASQIMADTANSLGFDALGYPAPLLLSKRPKRIVGGVSLHAQDPKSAEMSRVPGKGLSGEI